jgi:hypothetical protein
MPYNRDVFATLMPQIDAFVKHLICHRATRRHCDPLPLHIYWSLTSDAHLLQAIVCWCKVFGATGTNETHWQNLTQVDVANLQESFRDELHSRLGLEIADWARYHTEITNFRNKYVAHTEINYSQPVPDLNLALKIAFVFDEWVRSVIAPDTLDEQPLRNLANEFKITLEAYVTSLA